MSWEEPIESVYSLIRSCYCYSSDYWGEPVKCWQILRFGLMPACIKPIKMGAKSEIVSGHRQTGTGKVFADLRIPGLRRGDVIRPGSFLESLKVHHP
jgi:hypothetical protein